MIPLNGKFSQEGVVDPVVCHSKYIDPSSLIEELTRDRFVECIAVPVVGAHPKGGMELRIQAFPTDIHRSGFKLGVCSESGLSRVFLVQVLGGGLLGWC